MNTVLLPFLLATVPLAADQFSELHLAPKIEVPIAKDTTDKAKFQISISDNQKYFIEGVEFTLEQLQAVLVQAHSLQPGVALAISGLENVTFGHCREVIKAAAQANINQISFQHFYDEKKKSDSSSDSSQNKNSATK